MDSIQSTKVNCVIVEMANRSYFSVNWIKNELSFFVFRKKSIKYEAVKNEEDN